MKKSEIMANNKLNLLSDKNCKICNGIGLISFEHPDGFTVVDLCQCIRKHADKNCKICKGTGITNNENNKICKCIKV